MEPQWPAGFGAIGAAGGPAAGEHGRSLSDVVAMLRHHTESETAWLWIVEVAAVFAALTALPQMVGLGQPGTAGVHSQGTMLAAALTLALGVIALGIGLYRPTVVRHLRAFALNAAVATLVALPVGLAVCMAFRPDLARDGTPALALLARALLVWLLCLCVTRVVVRVAVRFGAFSRRVLLLGEADDAASLQSACAEAFEISHQPARPAPSPSELQARRIWALIGAAGEYGQLDRTRMTDYEAAGVKIVTRGIFFERHLRRIDLATLRTGISERMAGKPGPGLQDAARRGIDVALSLALLAFLLPLMLITAAIVRLTSPGSALFRQERVGLHGRSFMLLKFRSMRADAEANGKPVWALRHDPRVTQVGRFIRRTRIDELPQLLNVLRGDMSFIGPRPERPYFDRQLAEAIPGYAERHAVKPGISGWAQVNYRYGASVEDARMKLSYDLYYVKHRSLLLDLLIAIATVRVILLQEGSR